MYMQAQAETAEDIARRFYVMRGGKAVPPTGPDDVCKVVFFKKRRRDVDGGGDGGGVGGGEGGGEDEGNGGGGVGGDGGGEGCILVVDEVRSIASNGGGEGCILVVDEVRSIASRDTVEMQKLRQKLRQLCTHATYRIVMDADVSADGAGLPHACSP